MVGRSVVVGVDDSIEARDAAILGRRLATAAGGELHLVAAVSDPLADVAAARLRLDAGALHEAQLATARDSVRAGLGDVLGDGELDDALVVRLGRPEHVLGEYGREVGADSFVLGGRRHTGPTSWIRRGTAHHLLRVSGRPVLVTGPEGPEVDRVLIALDFSFAAAPTLRLATDLSRLLGARLEALHVVQRPRLPRGRDLGIDLEPYLEAREEEARREFRSLLPEGVSRRTVRGEPASEIQDAAVDGPPTLLVLGAQGRGRIHRLLLGSTTEAILARLPCSLAVVPPGEGASA